MELMSEKLKYKKYVLTISYGDHTIGRGGTDKVLLSQQKLFNEHGISMLHIAPRETMFKRPVRSGRLWCVIADGKLVRLADTYGVIRLMQAFQQQGALLQAVLIHHLNNTCVREVYKILKTTDAQIFFYLHDYYTVCPASGLLRDGREFCGVSFPGEKKCGCCSCYDKGIAERAELIRQLLKKIAHRTTAVAPSDDLLGRWLKAYPQYKGRTIVIPHQLPRGKYEGNMQPLDDSTPVRIAFVGYQMPHKGWAEWADAAEKAHRAGRKYQFYHMGSCEHKKDYITQVDVDFKKNPDAMTNALRSNAIDCAVLWSVVPETYSFTLFEAYCSNCFILTCSLSGNIAAVVNEKHNGIVAPERNDLADILLDEQALREQINLLRAKKQYGPMSMQDNDAIIKLLQQRADRPVKGVRLGAKRVAVNGMLGIYSVCVKALRRKN